MDGITIHEVLRCENGFTIIDSGNTYLLEIQLKNAARFAPECAVERLLDMQTEGEEEATKAIIFLANLDEEIRRSVLKLLAQHGDHLYAQAVKEYTQLKHEQDHFSSSSIIHTSEAIEPDDYLLRTDLPYKNYYENHCNMGSFEEYEGRNIEDFSDRFAPIEHSQWNNFLEDNSPKESELLCHESVDPLTAGAERYLCDDSAVYLVELEKQHLEEVHEKFLFGWGKPSDDGLESTDPAAPKSNK